MHTDILTEFKLSMQPTGLFPARPLVHIHAGIHHSSSSTEFHASYAHCSSPLPITLSEADTLAGMVGCLISVFLLSHALMHTALHHPLLPKGAAQTLGHSDSTPPLSLSIELLHPPSTVSHRGLHLEATSELPNPLQCDLCLGRALLDGVPSLRLNAAGRPPWRGRARRRCRVERLAGQL